MAKSEIKVDLNVLNVEMIKNLIELIEKHWEDMPEDLQKVIKEGHDTGYSDWGVDEYELYISSHNIHKDDIQFSHDKVLSVNKYLKKIYYGDGTHEYADEFYVKTNDVLIYGWNKG